MNIPRRIGLSLGLAGLVGCSAPNQLYKMEDYYFSEDMDDYHVRFYLDKTPEGKVKKAVLSIGTPIRNPTMVKRWTDFDGKGTIQEIFLRQKGVTRYLSRGSHVVGDLVEADQSEYVRFVGMIKSFPGSWLKMNAKDKEEYRQTIKDLLDSTK